MTGPFPSLEDSVSLLEECHGEDPVNADLIEWNSHLHLGGVKERGRVHCQSDLEV